MSDGFKFNDFLASGNNTVGKKQSESYLTKLSTGKPEDTNKDQNQNITHMMEGWNPPIPKSE